MNFFFQSYPKVYCARHCVHIIIIIIIIKLNFILLAYCVYITILLLFLFNTVSRTSIVRKNSNRVSSGSMKVFLEYMGTQMTKIFFHPLIFIYYI